MENEKVTENGFCKTYLKTFFIVKFIKEIGILVKKMLAL